MGYINPLEGNSISSVGNLNSDNIPDILGVGFKFFLGNQNGYDFVGDDTNFINPLIEYNFNRPFAIELYDFDGDGVDEIISSDGRVRISHNGGRFQPAPGPMKKNISSHILYANFLDLIAHISPCNTYPNPKYHEMSFY